MEKLVVELVVEHKESEKKTCVAFRTTHSGPTFKWRD